MQLDPQRVMAGRRIHRHFECGMERRDAAPGALERMQLLYGDVSYQRPGNWAAPADWYEGLVHRPDGTVEFWRRGERAGAAGPTRSAAA